MQSDRNILPAEYARLLGAIKERVRTAQYEALRAVNKELVALYWDIGRMIVERQQGRSGARLWFRTLADDLQKEFPGMSGFSARNIWRMRDLFLAYHENEKVTPLVAQIGWSHKLIILTHCNDPLEREFYIRMTGKHGGEQS